MKTNLDTESFLELYVLIELVLEVKYKITSRELLIQRGHDL